MPVLLSHATGNANVREATRALSDAGMLSEFWTSINWRPENPLGRVLPGVVSDQLNRRSFSHLRADQVHSYPWFEVGRLVATHLRLSSLARHETGAFCVDAVYHHLDEKVASTLRYKKGLQAVYAYDDGALASFRSAKRLGLACIYELPTGHWKARCKILQDEAELHPEWAATIPGNADSLEKLVRKDEELALADRVLVPSLFVRQTLAQAGFINSPIEVVPYGAPQLSVVAPARKGATRLRVLFVGRLSQAKGLTYLFGAVQQLRKTVELTVLGPKVANCNALDSALQIHRWIPSMPHAQVLQEMRQHDVLVFPSLFEGFGLVLLEAMSQGLPVIATPNTSGPDFVNEGKDGFIIPIRNTEAITEKLDLLARDRERLAVMSKAAQQTAILHSWQHYRERLVTVVQQVLVS